MHLVGYSLKVTKRSFSFSSDSLKQHCILPTPCFFAYHGNLAWPTVVRNHSVDCSFTPTDNLKWAHKSTSLAKLDSHTRSGSLTLWDCHKAAWAPKAGGPWKWSTLTPLFAITCPVSIIFPGSHVWAHNLRAWEQACVSYLAFILTNVPTNGEKVF